MELDELKELNATDVVNEVGNLYSLGDDAIPILADHLEEMQTVQDKINDIVVAAQTAIDEMEKTKKKIGADIPEEKLNEWKKEYRRIDKHRGI